MSVEQQPTTPQLPSGFEAVRALQEYALVDETVLPWVDGQVELSLAECRLANGESFILANAVGTHPKLVAAAEAMTDQQQTNVNNMFYSRIQTYVEQGYAPNIESMPAPGTGFPIKVMRNQGGQRVYFGMTNLLLTSGETRPVVMRLAACDKNKQSSVTSVLTGLSDKAMRRRNTKGAN